MQPSHIAEYRPGVSPQPAPLPREQDSATETSRKILHIMPAEARSLIEQVIRAALIMHNTKHKLLPLELMMQVPYKPYGTIDLARSQFLFNSDDALTQARARVTTDAFLLLVGSARYAMTQDIDPRLYLVNVLFDSHMEAWDCDEEDFQATYARYREFLNARQHNRAWWVIKGMLAAINGDDPNIRNTGIAAVQHQLFTLSDAIGDEFQQAMRNMKGIFQA